MTNFTAVGFLRYAREYLDSAQHLRVHCSVKMLFSYQPPLPAFYCLGHGIELTLKAYLLQVGVTHAELKSKKLGHDIPKLFTRARVKGLPKLSPELSIIPPALRKLQYMNDNGFLLRYRPEGGQLTRALDSRDWDALEKFAVEHYNHVASSIEGPNHFKRLVKCKSPEVETRGLNELANFLSAQ